MNSYSNFNVKTIPEDFLVEECVDINYSYSPDIYALFLLRKKII